jgi:precorrin-2/cobalt-factor-2 C20-methyltransferase
MRKTSVYLSEALQAELAAAAARAGTSQADFIRAALTSAVRQPDAARSPTPAQRRLRGPALVGVGVGPGAADLLTPRARDVILEADTVVATSVSPDAIGRAEATVRAALGPVRVVRLPLDVTDTPARRVPSLSALADRLVTFLDRGQVVAFLTIGDPNMFSIFSSAAGEVGRLRPDVSILSVPGIMAFQELAARAGRVVARDGQSVRIVAAGQDLDEPGARAADSLTLADETLVLYRGGRLVPTIAAQLTGTDRADEAVVGELLGLPGERCAAAAEFVDQPASYLASLIAPAPAT